jgi:hypothetical protein
LARKAGSCGIPRAALLVKQESGFFCWLFVAGIVVRKWVYIIINAFREKGDSQ